MFEKDLRIAILLDVYGVLLTERRAEALDMYYNEDFSLSEIAEQFGISRQGVRDMIKKGQDELLFLEEKLGLSSRLAETRGRIESIEARARAEGASEELLRELGELSELLK